MKNEEYVLEKLKEEVLNEVVSKDVILKEVVLKDNSNELGETGASGGRKEPFAVGTGGFSAFAGSWGRSVSGRSTPNISAS